MNFLILFKRLILKSMITLGLFLVVVMWPVLVCYFPRYDMLVSSSYHAWYQPTQSDQIAKIAATLPKDGPAIERYVKETLVPYDIPWNTYHLPWVYPSVDMALNAAQGDCQAQFIVLSALLDAKHIPHRMRASLDHIWVEYPGRVVTSPIEMPAKVIVTRDSNGTETFDLSKIEWLQSARSEWEYFVTPMPLLYRLTICLGYAAMVLVWTSRRRLLRQKRYIAIPA